MADSRLQTNQELEKGHSKLKMEVNIEKELGKGAFGTVYLMNFKSSKQEHKLALKLIEIKEKYRKKMLQEMELMKDLDHKHIVKYYTGLLHENKILLLLEFCAGTDLHLYLKKCRPSSFLTEPQVYKFASQIASAIMYLHKKHIIHRDIKPNNILLTKDDHVKLADFGLSRQLENTLAHAETRCGTQIYMAPEVLNREKYSYKADAWSFGCVLHKLMSLHYPFKADYDSETKNRIRSTKFSDLPNQYNDNLHILVKMLLVVDVDKRLKVADAFSSLQGMREDATDILPPVPEIPILPDKKTVMSAVRKYIIECNQSSSFEAHDPVPKSQLDHVQDPSPKSQLDHVHDPVPKSNLDHVHDPVPKSQLDHVHDPCPKSNLDHVHDPVPKSNLDHVHDPVPKSNLDHVHDPVPKSNLDHVHDPKSHSHNLDHVYEYYQHLDGLSYHSESSDSRSYSDLDPDSEAQSLSIPLSNSEYHHHLNPSLGYSSDSESQSD